MEKKLPLEGLKVLDFTIALAGPFTAWQLADMGAEVWKIERYGSGDQCHICQIVVLLFHFSFLHCCIV